MVQKTQFDQTSRERERERDTLISFFLGLPVGFFWSSLELPKHSSRFESFQFDPAIIHSKEMVLFASIAFKLIGSSSIDLNLLHSLKLRIVSRLRKSTLSRRRIFGRIYGSIYGRRKYRRVGSRKYRSLGNITGCEPGFEPEGGQSLKQNFFMKIKTNIYFIFKKILHIK